MPIYIKTLTGKTYTVSVDKNYSIKLIKILITENEGIPVDQQRIKFGGKILEDNRTLSDYGINKEVTLHLTIRLRKPVIYLYPKKTSNINVKIVRKNCAQFSCVYLKFTKINKWEVTAEKNGEIKIEDKVYPYLFWEANGIQKFNFEKGFYVKGENAVEFLEDKLTKIGLNEKEKSPIPNPHF